MGLMTGMMNRTGKSTKEMGTSLTTRTTMVSVKMPGSSTKMLNLICSATMIPTLNQWSNKSRHKRRDLAICSKK